MSDAATIRMIALYQSMRSPELFLSSMFQSPAENFHSSEEVEVDITRTDEDVSIPVQDLSVKGRYVAQDLYTNKKFRPPVHKEIAPLNAYKMIGRRPGENPFMDPDFMANASMEALRMAVKMEAMIKRAIELQASQVLQDGKLTLKDENGNDAFLVDYSPKASHFVDSALPWTDANAAIITDLENLTDTIRDDGLEDPDQVVMGVAAFEALVANEEVRKRLDNRRIELGSIGSAPLGKGGQFRGFLDVGNYKLQIWTYNGKYKDPTTGNKLSFVDPANVIVRASTGRMDATFGAVPRFMTPRGGSLALPQRISEGVDVNLNSWVTEDGEQLFVKASSRPLLIPTAIDTYGRINTQV